MKQRVFSNIIMLYIALVRSTSYNLVPKLFFMIELSDGGENTLAKKEPFLLEEYDPDHPVWGEEFVLCVIFARSASLASL
jgi:hypothetical protein